MKRRYLVVILSLIIIGLLVWWAWHPKSNKQQAEKPAETSEQLTTDKSQVSQQTSQPPPARQKSQYPKRPANLDPSGTEADTQYYQKYTTDPLYDWKQPINFYGKVLDDNEQPIEGATIQFSWNDLSPEGTSEAQTKSAIDGLFSLVNRTGKRLSVTVGKDGYYARKGEVLRSFEYANPADGLFSPDPDKPVIYHLRKQGVGVDLVTSDRGMSPSWVPKLLRDGTPVRLDLLKRKVDLAGQLELSQYKPPYQSWKTATEWSFRMSIPDGGLVEHVDEFPFEAPEAGYQPTIEFNFQADQPNWTASLKKRYYFVFGSPPRYGRLDVETDITRDTVRLTYAINPDGSRNLEPK